MLTLKTTEIAKLWGLTPQRLKQLMSAGDIKLEEVSPGRYRTADVAALLGVTIEQIIRELER